ncbi:MAG: efflux RND transporter periplasmic adaptor subunit [Mangrovibacterium sp.]
MKKHRKAILIGIAAVMAFAVLLVLWLGGTTAGSSQLVKRGTLVAVVPGRGEVQGENSIKIELPDVLQDNQLRVWSYKINDLVEEGKRVKKGDFIAQLDPSELMNNMRERMTEKERVDADLKNAVIDSAVTLTGRREEIINARLDLQYKQIDLDMSKFEAGAQQRKAQMAYQKAEIDLDKKKRDYLLTQNRLKVRIIRYEERAERLQELIDKFQQALGVLHMTSPGDGIVMIAEDYLGKKLTKDSRISNWMPTLATLPDMSSAIVETYIKEIDITKISLGDSVRILVDALPEKNFSGKVVKIANMGEDKSGVDMKVFKVIIRFDHADPDLKPGMTCNNDIVVESYTNVLLAPLQSVFKSGQSPIVYLKRGGEIVPQPVELGAEDQVNVVVLKGLEEGDRLLLYEPALDDVGS